MKFLLKFKTVFAVMAVFIIAIGVYALTINFYVIGYSHRYFLSQDEVAKMEDVDYVVVLGCEVHADGTPSDMLYERCKTGCEVFKNSKSKALLLSGDKTEGYNEPKCMKKESIKHGVEENAIKQDFYGFSTFESMFNAKQKFGAKKIIVITQSYHLSRAIYIARKLGVEAYGVPAYMRPMLKQVIWSTREMLARNKDFLQCIWVRFSENPENQP